MNKVLVVLAISFFASLGFAEDRQTRGLDSDIQSLFQKAVDSTPPEVVLEELKKQGYELAELPWGPIRLIDKVDQAHLPGASSKQLSELQHLSAFSLKFEDKPGFTMYIVTSSKTWREILETYHRNPEELAAPALLAGVIGHEIAHVVTKSKDDAVPLLVEKAIFLYHQNHPNKHFRSFPGSDKALAALNKQIEGAGL